MKRISRWPWLLVLALVTLGLGWAGFSALPPEIRPTPEERLIRTLKFFKADGILPVEAPATLRMARVTGALFTVVALIQVWRRFFHEQIELFHLSHWRHHSVVCGLGRKGMHLVECLRTRKRRVAVAQLQPDEDDFAACRRLGAIPVGGDSTKLNTLERLRIEQASEVFAVCGDDRTNFEIALQLIARYRSAGCTHPVTCFVHLVDLPLLHQLQHRDFFAERPPGLALTFFNTHEHAARRLMTDHPLPVRTSSAEPALHLLIVGAGPALRALVLHHARTAHLGDLRTPRITLLAPSMEQERAALLGAFPALAEVAKLAWHEFTLNDRTLGSLDTIIEPNIHLRVIVALPTDEASLTAALMLRESGLGVAVPILMRTEGRSGITRLLRGANQETARLNLVSFGAVEDVCGTEVLLHQELDRLAESFHEAYRQSQLKSGTNPAGNPSLRTWQELPEDLRAANRVLADHLDIKRQTLAALRPDTTPVDAPPAKEEVELLARMEHNRWCAERRLAGWQHGVPRDNPRRRHPSLVPWEQLSEGERQKDRDAVLAVTRVHPAEHP